MSDKERISLSDAEALIESAFVASGVPESVALSVSKALVAAEAEGQVGHGFSRVDDYIAQAKSGKVAGDAVPQIIKTGTSSIIIDAGHGFAYPALEMAIEEGAKLAVEHGTASVGITRSHHCGALSVQVEKLAQHGLVAIMVANTPSAIAPWGASKPVFGTNPIAFAAPRAGHPPLVIDMSLSVVARGKVMNAKKAGNAIPPEWALDADGNPTTDPNEALAGSMRPIGDAKGTALALMVEILAGVMTGANLSSEASSFFAADGPPPGVGQFILVLRPGDPSGFAERLEHLLMLIAELEGTRLPGDRRAKAIALAQSNGIEAPAHYLTRVREIAGAA